MSSLSNNQQRWLGNRLQAPEQDGEVLQVPPLASVGQLLKDNRQRLALGLTLGTLGPWQVFAEQARREAIAQAQQYTRTYRDVDFSDRDQATLFLAGHQPKLFHPGVWIKNFALSQLAERHRAVAINLVIDNDLCGTSAIVIPQRASDASWQARSIAYDQSTASLPIESAAIVDRDLFRSFPERLQSALTSAVAHPLVIPLWKTLSKLNLATCNRYRALAMARHTLEAQSGLSTWELPISQLSQTPSFCRFVADIAARLDEFHLFHNTALADYRREHRIRSLARPVPPLTTRDSWREMPFWVYSGDYPTRRRLFVRRHEQHLEWTDHSGWSQKAPLGDMVESLVRWQKEGLCIRPRALTTTMYSRLFLSDLFIHGIGGAIYDRVGDTIAAQFYGTAMPQHITLSATFRLPIELDHCDLPAPQALKSQRRQMWYQPERFVSPGSNDAAVVSLKSGLLATQPAPRDHRRRSWH
ncbi:MAG TPA: hypothetical protein PKD54_00680, partial [Pirellulaceae bacterium]|nr:hypothetical protein [Pirellulaceae bacterium]